MNNKKYTTEQLQYYFEDRIKQLYPKFEKHPTLIQLDGLYHRIKQHRPYEAHQQSLHHIFQYCIKYSDAQLRWNTNDNDNSIFKDKINQLYRLRHKVLQYKRYEDQLILIKQNILQRNQQYEEGNTNANYVSFFDNVVFSGNSLQVQHKNKLIQLDQSKDFINSMYSDWYKSLLNKFYTQQQWMVEGHINTATIQTDYIPLESQFNVQFKLNEESNHVWYYPQYTGLNRNIIIKYKRCLLYDVDTKYFYITLKLKDVTTNDNTYSNAVRNMIHYMIRGRYKPIPILISMEDSVGEVHQLGYDKGSCYIQKMETYTKDDKYLLGDQIDSQVLYNSIVKFKCNIVDYKPRIINLEIDLFTLMMGPDDNAHHNKIQQPYTNTVKLSFEVQMSNYINHNIKYQPQHLPDYNELDKITYIARDNK